MARNFKVHQGGRLPAYRRKEQRKDNRLSMVIVAFVMMAIVVVVAVQSATLRTKIADVEAREDALNTQIAAEEARAEEIEEYRIYTQTKGYYKEIATDKLGLVDENEIILKKED